MSGRTDGYRPVSIKSADLEIGDIVATRIMKAEGHWLYGELCPQTAATA